MVVLKVAEIDNAALQCTTLCAYGGNFEYSSSVFKIGNVKGLKSIKKAVAYQHTYRLLHILPALLVKCHFENVYVCI